MLCQTLASVPRDRATNSAPPQTWVLEEGSVRGGNIGAAALRNPDARRRKSRRVVDSIADHDHGGAGFQLGDRLKLRIRQQLGFDLEAETLGNCFAGAPIVAPLELGPSALELARR